MTDKSESPVMRERRLNRSRVEKAIRCIELTRFAPGGPSREDKDFQSREILARLRGLLAMCP